MGMKGAAIATLISFIIGAILSAVVGRKYFALPFPLIDFIKIILATVVMSFFLWWFKENRGWLWLAFQLMTGLFTYGALIIAFNILDIRDSLKNHLIKELKI